MKQFKKETKEQDKKVVEELTTLLDEKVAEEDEVKVGVVVNCEVLNVREAPKGDAEILATIKSGSEVMIDTKKSTPDFYKVYNEASVEGFCMKKFIKVQ